MRHSELTLATADLCAIQRVLVCATHHARTPPRPKRRPLRPQHPIFGVVHRGGLRFGHHTTPNRDFIATSRGGIALHKPPTRRRHAARGLRVVQNPQRSPRQSRLHPSQCRRLHTPSATPTPSTPSMRSSSTPPPTPSVPSTPAPPAPKPKQLARTDADMAGVLADLGMLSLLGALAVAARRHGA